VSACRTLTRPMAGRQFPDASLFTYY